MPSPCDTGSVKNSHFLKAEGHFCVTAPHRQRWIQANSIRSDAMQLLLQDVRRGNRTAKDALATHDRVTGVKIRLLGDRVSRGLALRIALEQDWGTLRDAEYVAITRLQADAFVTIDARLAAKVAPFVPVQPIEALVCG